MTCNAALVPCQDDLRVCLVLKANMPSSISVRISEFWFEGSAPRKRCDTPKSQILTSSLFWNMYFVRRKKSEIFVPQVGGTAGRRRTRPLSTARFCSREGIDLSPTFYPVAGWRGGMGGKIVPLMYSNIRRKPARQPVVRLPRMVWNLSVFRQHFTRTVYYLSLWPHLHN